MSGVHDEGVRGERIDRPVAGNRSCSMRWGRWAAGGFAIPVGIALALGSCGRPKPPCVGGDCPPPPEKECVADQRPLSPDGIDELRPNIVQVVTDSSLGSGFMLRTQDEDDVLIVTNYHVIVEGDSFSVAFVRDDGSVVQVAGVEVVKASPEHDLALLKAPRMSAFGDGLELSVAPRTGQSAVTLGYPMLSGMSSATPSLTSGLVTGLDREVRGRKYLQTDLSLVAGNSGGPVVDSCGQVVGVAAARHTEATHVGLLVPAAEVAQLYQAYLAPRPPAAEEVKAQLVDFLVSLQRDEAVAASAHFSRGFIEEYVFPAFKEHLDAAIAKQDLLERAFRELRVDPDDLTPEQVEWIATQLGLDMSPEEVLSISTILQAKREGWDAYATLQAYMAPFVDGFFGRIDRFEVQDVDARDGELIAYVQVYSNRSESRLLRFTFTDEWGDHRIADIRERNTPEAPADADTRLSQEPSERGEWVEVGRHR